MVGKVGYLVFMVELLVVCLGGSVTKFDLSEEVKKNGANSGLGLKVMFGGSLFVSGTCMLQLSFQTISKLF